MSRPGEAAPRLILASKSPRRVQLLQMLGLEFEVRPADVEESRAAGELPAAYAERLARDKAAAIAVAQADAVVIGSDTVVVVDDEVLEKPRDETEAVAMLMRLQGRAHEVATGIALAYRGEARTGVERVAVTFRPFSERTARAYAATGEPLDKAGAYGIQGFGAALVEGIEGDFFAVMGLPVARLIAMLAELGFEYDFRGLRRRDGAAGETG
jgi:septum formation protein